VEVKNCHKSDPNHRYKVKRAYLNALNAYARIFGRELLMAVFWSRWKKRTLLRSQDFAGTGENPSICFVEAVGLNRMEMLGDMMIATTPPLAFRIVVDPRKPRRLNDGGQGVFTIGDVELYCNGQRLEDPYERQLAFYFMLNSDWATDDSRAEVRNNELVYIECISQPQEPVPNQHFQCLGFLSDMITRHYNELTVDDGRVIRLSPVADPGTLGIVIPLGYQGKQLPLWQFQCRPHERRTGSPEG
jgi:hypothetical protein